MIAYTILVEKEKWGKQEEELLSFVSPERQEKIRSLRFDSGKLTALYGALLVRMSLSKLVQTDPGEFVIAKEAHGKPYVQGRKDCYFNLSHTKGCILCGVSNTSELGVDVELLDKKAPYGVMKRVFHEQEIAYVESSEKKKEEAFFEVWTSKEAYTKQLGCGLTISLTECNTSEEPIQRKLWHWTENGYLYCVCSEEPVERKNIIMDELLAFYEDLGKV